MSPLSCFLSQSTEGSTSHSSTTQRIICFEFILLENCRKQLNVYAFSCFLRVPSQGERQAAGVIKCGSISSLFLRNTQHQSLQSSLCKVKFLSFLNKCISVPYITIDEWCGSLWPSLPQHACSTYSCLFSICAQPGPIHGWFPKPGRSQPTAVAAIVSQSLSDSSTFDLLLHLSNL